MPHTQKRDGSTDKNTRRTSDDSEEKFVYVQYVDNHATCLLPRQRIRHPDPTLIWTESTMRLLRGADLRAAAVRLALEGLRPAEIAIRLGHKAATVSAALSNARALGLYVPCTPPGYLPGAPTSRRAAGALRHQAMAALVAQGLSAREVAERMGTTPSSVSSTLCRMRASGVPVPVGRPGRPKKTQEAQAA